MSAPINVVAGLAPAAKPAAPNPWATLFLFLGLGITCSIDRFILASLLTPITHDLHLTDEQAARTWVAYTVAHTAALLFLTWWSLRSRRKAPILIGLVIWSVATIGSGLAGALLPLLFWRAAVGFGEGGFIALSPSWLADVFGAKWRNLVFGIFGSTAYIACGIGYVAGGWIAAHYGWSKAFFLAGVPGLVLAVLLFFLREPERGHADRDARAAQRRVRFKDVVALFRLPAFSIHLVGRLAYGFGLSGLLWGPMFFHRAFGLTNQASSAFFGYSFGIAGVIGAVFGGWVGSAFLRQRRAGYEILLAVAAALTASSLLPGFQSPEIGLAKLGIVLGLFGNGLGTGVQTTVTVESVPVELRDASVLIGFLGSAFFGSVISSESIGIVSDHFGLRAALLLVPAAFGTSALSWVVLAVYGYRRKGVRLSGESALRATTAQPA
jgi:predicted MFS family arabinose efflux permease